MPQLYSRCKVETQVLICLPARHYKRPACRSWHPTHPSRKYATQRNAPLVDIPDVAVLGGGITGLSTAYYLKKHLPAATRIVLFEASSRLGGWLNSTFVDVGNGKVVFEGGPRTLRPTIPNGLVTLDLVSRNHWSSVFFLFLFLFLVLCVCSVITSS